MCLLRLEACTTRRRLDRERGIGHRLKPVPQQKDGISLQRTSLLRITEETACSLWFQSDSEIRIENLEIRDTSVRNSFSKNRVVGDHGRSDRHLDLDDSHLENLRHQSAPPNQAPEHQMVGICGSGCRPINH